MIFKATIFATLLALAASEQAVQPYPQSPSYNVPGNPVFPQGEQYPNYYDGQYQGSYPFYGIFRPFKQFPFISLVNNENKPLGYIYWADSEAVLKQLENFIPVRDQYGNLLGYYALNQYKTGEQFQPKILDENLVSQLGQFGFIYNPPSQNKFGFLVVKNPYVFYYNQKGVLRPDAIQYYRFKFQFPYNFFGPNYNGQYQYPSEYYYGQQYQGPYFPKYQPQYNPYYQFPYNYNYYNQYLPPY